MRAEADGGVERLRASVKEIERPDVDRAAGEIDSCRCGRSDVHGTIIIFSGVLHAPDDAREIGQLLIGSFPGTTLSQEWRSLAREFDLGGAILFSRNIEAPEQVAELAGEMRSARPHAARLGERRSGRRPGGAPQGALYALAADGHARPRRFRGARASGSRERLRTSSRAVGITLDYAPVLDIHTNPKNPVIGDRALAERADEVARLGSAIIRGLQAEGVAACGKHFPGHGDTSTDSHVDLPLVEHPPDRLRAVEFEPFRAAVREQVAFIMTAHVFVPALDEERPATLSPRGGAADCSARSSDSTASFSATTSR